LVYTYSYQQVFSGNSTGDLSTLKMTLGAVMGESIDTSLVNLRPYSSGVFIPDNTSFYTCDPLPIEWLEAMPNVTERQKRLEAKKPAKYDRHDPFADLLALPPPLEDEKDDPVSPPPKHARGPSMQLALLQPTPPARPRAPSKHHLLVQVHAVYCLRAKYALIIEFVLFGSLYTLEQKQSYRLQTTGAGTAVTPNSPNQVAATTQNSKVVIFDSNERIPIPTDEEDQLPTFLVLHLKEVVNTNRELLVRRRPSRLRDSSAAAAAAADAAVNQISRGRWSATVNISSIKQTNNTGSASTTTLAASAACDSGSGGGAVEGTFDLTPTVKIEEDRFTETPYMSLAIRYQ
jgi:hypothetical protein